MSKQEIRKELKVSAIENGTVIDHIPAQSVFQVINILGLDYIPNQILLFINLKLKFLTVLIKLLNALILTALPTTKIFQHSLVLLIKKTCC
jgi:aspartate carbamoyltransferase regulatory subunit